MKETIQYIEEELRSYYPNTEIRGFIRLIFEYVCNLNYTELVLNRDKKLNAGAKESICLIVQRLKTYEPIQYILGETEFAKLRFSVKSPVFIPRPETGELVEWILETNSHKSPAILDIGTGSGCIALALKKEVEGSYVSGIDISEDAVKMARANGVSNNLQVNFFCADIFHWESYSWDKYDIIVSNPPYIMEKEKKDMHPNVLRFEPWRALFVPNNEPLIFYQVIAGFARHFLREGGWLFFEINEKLGNELVLLLKDEGFGKIEIKRDINNKERMIRCRR